MESTMTKIGKQMIKEVIQEALDEAEKAANAYAQQNPHWYPCGFAWVNIKPGTSPVAKTLKEMGLARKSYEGGVDVWNPSKLTTQQMDTKMAGAMAFAKVLQERLGVNAVARERMD